MTTPVSTGGYDPISYLNKITGKAPAPTPSATPSASPTPTSSSNATDISDQLLSLLGATNGNSAQGSSLSGLLGGNSNDPLAGLYSSLIYNKTTSAPIQQAIDIQQQSQAKAATQNNPLKDLLASFNTASNAYNKTLLSNAAAALKANNGSLT